MRRGASGAAGMNAGNDRVTFGQASLEMHRAARMGYLGALAGELYPPAYDDLPQDAQLAFETARLWASLILAAKVTPPDWPEERILPPLALSQTVAELVTKDGNPIPGDRQPPNSDPVALDPATLPQPRRGRRHER